MVVELNTAGSLVNIVYDHNTVVCASLSKQCIHRASQRLV